MSRSVDHHPRNYCLTSPSPRPRLESGNYLNQNHFKSREIRIHTMQGAAATLQLWIHVASYPLWVMLRSATRSRHITPWSHEAIIHPCISRLATTLPLMVSASDHLMQLYFSTFLYRLCVLPAGKCSCARTHGWQPLSRTTFAWQALNYHENPALTCNR